MAPRGQPFFLTAMAIIFIVFFFASLDSRGRYSIFVPSISLQDNAKPYDIPIELNVTRINDTSAKPGHGKPACSFGLIREYIQKHGKFPQGGVWKEDSKLQPKLQPQWCRLDANLIRGSQLLDCLNQKNTTHFVVTGDSQGFRYGQGLLANLNETLGGCYYVKREASLTNNPIDISYFSDGDPHLEARMKPMKRDCSTCSSFKAICGTPFVHNVTVEYIAMHSMLGNIMTVVLDRKNSSAHTVGFHEFLFRKYFKDSYPDFLVVVPTMNHAISRYAPDTFLDHLASFRDLTDRFLPPHSHIVWIPGMTIHGTTRTKSNNRAMAAMNLALYNLLEISNSSRHLGFLDLFQATEKAKQWARDRIHMQQFLYNHFMSYMLQMFCQG